MPQGPPDQGVEERQQDPRDGESPHPLALGKPKAGFLCKDVYNEQKTEIVDTLKELRRNLKNAIKSSKKWIGGIKKTLKQLEKDISRVNAKFKIGDISRDTFESSKYRFERNIRIVKGGRERLETLIRLAEKR